MITKTININKDAQLSIQKAGSRDEDISNEGFCELSNTYMIPYAENTIIENTKIYPYTVLDKYKIIDLNNITFYLDKKYLRGSRFDYLTRTLDKFLYQYLEQIDKYTENDNVSFYTLFFGTDNLLDKDSFYIKSYLNLRQETNEHIFRNYN